MSERARNVIAAVVVVASLAVVVTVMASAEPTDADRAHALALQLKCPMCDSESIADSPTAIARDLYELIRDRVAEGWSDDEITAFFVATYGEQVLLDPPIDARTIGLWLIPALALVAGVVIIVTRRSPAPARDLTDDERRRLDEEIRAREA